MKQNIEEAQDIYQDLEQTFLTYGDLRDVPVSETGEEMICLKTVKTSNCDPDMCRFTGDDIYVRATIADKLAQAQQKLSETYPDYMLEIVYGYRHASIQQAKFEALLQAHNLSADDENAKEKIHRYIAVPEVAGHPTGGAVDLHILDPMGNPLDMGTQIAEFVKDSYVFSPFIGEEAKKNRQILRNIMMGVGFAPFDGEWWHFSYGDREWAHYYQQPCALYAPVMFELAQK